MKNLRTHAVCLCIMLVSICTAAQNNDRPPLNEPDYNRPRLFNNLPEKVALNVSNVSSLFNASIGGVVDVELSENAQFRLNGEIIANTTTERIQKVVIRSSNFNGANMTIIKVKNEDGSTNYLGRILSFKHGDFYELQKSTEGYVLVKRDYYELVNE